MTYDGIRSRVVFVHHAPMETWEWDGNDWTRVTTATVPPLGSSLTYDLVRRRVVMLADNGFWENDGTDWVLVSPPLDSDSQGVVYDDARLRLVYAAQRGARTWLRGLTVAASVTPHGNGCAGTNGVPTLSARGRPRLSNDEFRFELGSARPNAAGVVLLSRVVSGTAAAACSIAIGGVLVTLVVAFDANARGEGMASLAARARAVDTALAWRPNSSAPSSAPRGMRSRVPGRSGGPCSSAAHRVSTSCWSSSPASRRATACSTSRPASASRR
jgi:hypothetical protein